MNELFRVELNQLGSRSLLRNLREVGSPQGPVIRLVGRELVNFSSNDYLGLSADPRLRTAAKRAIDDYGVGAGASRLISGTQSAHVELERAIATWKGAPAALTFSSGYAAVSGTLAALATRDDVIILDKLAHASLIDGARLSGAKIRVFPHNHLGKLESHLEWARRELPTARVIIATESVFSMDGDRAPLREIAELKSRFNTLLLVDEAHASGLIGPYGRGLADEENVSDAIDLQIGTLSKAIGAAGGYVCGSLSAIHWLINRARPFIYSTAPPPAIAAAATAAIQFLQSKEGEELRNQLWRNVSIMHELLGFEGQTCGASAILPVLLGDERAAVETSGALMEAGFFVPAIRYPTVPRGKARLRLTVTAAHSEAQIRSVAAAIHRLRTARAASDLNDPVRQSS